MASPSQLPVPVKKQRRATNASATTPAFVIKKRFDDNNMGFKAVKTKDRLRGAHRDLTLKIDDKPATSTIPFVTSSDNEEDYILVMGSSGAGKTSFINVASGSRLPVSSGLNSCTTEIAVSEPFMLDGRRVRLVDTPGFDDSSRSDADVLATIARFLAQEYTKGRKLQGILYFHRISDVRMGALSKRNFVMFQKMCGEHTYANVVLVTSRWSEVNELVGISRENELKSKGIFFKPLIEAGAPLVRYERNIDSAHHAIRQVLRRAPVTLTIQKEMAVERKALAQTQAGMELQLEKLGHIQKYQESLKGLTQEIEIVKQENDMQTQQELEADLKELLVKMKVLEEENRKLLSRKSSWEWELVPAAKDIPDIPSEASTRHPTSADLKDIPSETSSAVQDTFASRANAIRVASQAEEEEEEELGTTLGVPPTRTERLISDSEPRMIGAMPRETHPTTTAASTQAAKSAPASARKAPIADVVSEGKCCGGSGSDGLTMSWGDWLFSMHPSILLPFTYILSGLLGQASH
ncbi:hypothetical protein FA15DRAFT_697568 [Coprinopsis marcescibilis]|uniref:G domain-containing protein n=1 Tax=Coprinopsis marcescibilis TaxID=230819 RepID=A0A5C3KH53_COPMA|nr:hypothetical protein FA15DRAFT_697568 [Coprinopsis marcescibilis]